MHFSFTRACLSRAVVVWFQATPPCHPYYLVCLVSSCRSSVSYGTSIDFNVLMVMCLLTKRSFLTDKRNSTAVCLKGWAMLYSWVSYGCWDITKHEVQSVLLLWVRNVTCWSSPSASLVSMKTSPSWSSGSFTWRLKSPVITRFLCSASSSVRYSENSSTNWLFVTW